MRSRDHARVRTTVWRTCPHGAHRVEEGVGVCTTSARANQVVELTLLQEWTSITPLRAHKFALTVYDFLLSRVVDEWTSGNARVPSR